MSLEFPENSFSEVHPTSDIARFPFGEIPYHLDALPESGREVLVLGDTEGCKELNHRQGDNPFGFRGTCGLVACEDVLRQFGRDVDEGDVVRHALISGLCSVSARPEASGGTSVEGQVRILNDGDVPAHVETNAGIIDLVRWVSEGRGVIVEVNAGELWDNPSAYDSGDPNHAVVVTGIALNPVNGALEGIYINDSGRGYPVDSGRFLDIDLVQRSWADVGGVAAVTDSVRI